jgi:hypothetical protein
VDSLAQDGFGNNHFDTFPSNGTILDAVDNGAIYEIGGGAPLHVNTCSAGGVDLCSGAVDVTEWTIDSLAEDATGNQHLTEVPGNGTILDAVDNGAIYEIAGGAPLHVNTCSAGGVDLCSGAVDVTEWTIDSLAQDGSGHSHLNNVPTSGTTVRASDDGAIYEIVGDAPLYLDSCTPGGVELCNNTVSVTQWTINALAQDATGNNHLDSVPADGTQVEGLPSTDEWTFTDGALSPTSDVQSPIQTTDDALSAFSQGSDVGNGLPEAPIAISLPLLAIAIMGVLLAIRSRRSRRHVSGKRVGT